MAEDLQIIDEDMLRAREVFRVKAEELLFERVRRQDSFNGVLEEFGSEISCFIDSLIFAIDALHDSFMSAAVTIEEVDGALAKTEGSLTQMVTEIYRIPAVH